MCAVKSLWLSPALFRPIIRLPPPITMTEEDDETGDSGMGTGSGGAQFLPIMDDGQFALSNE